MLVFAMFVLYRAGKNYGHQGRASLYAERTLFTQEIEAHQRSRLRLREAVERLVQLNEVAGNKDEAAKWRKELEEMGPPAEKKKVKP
jgi:hypothetical protein